MPWRSPREPLHLLYPPAVQLQFGRHYPPVLKGHSDRRDNILSTFLCFFWGAPPGVPVMQVVVAVVVAVARSRRAPCDRWMDVMPATLMGQVRFMGGRRPRWAWRVANATFVPGGSTRDPRRAPLNARRRPRPSWRAPPPRGGAGSASGRRGRARPAAHPTCCSSLRGVSLPKRHERAAPGRGASRRRTRLYGAWGRPGPP